MVEKAVDLAQTEAMEAVEAPQTSTQKKT